ESPELRAAGAPPVARAEAPARQASGKQRAASSICTCQGMYHTSRREERRYARAYAWTAPSTLKDGTTAGACNTAALAGPSDATDQCQRLIRHAGRASGRVVRHAA